MSRLAGGPAFLCGVQRDALKTKNRIVREADLVADVSIDLEFTEHEWSPFIRPSDVEKLDAVRRALRSGDVREAMRYGAVYRLTPVSAA